MQPALVAHEDMHSLGSALYGVICSGYGVSSWRLCGCGIPPTPTSSPALYRQSRRHCVSPGLLFPCSKTCPLDPRHPMQSIRVPAVSGNEEISSRNGASRNRPHKLSSEILEFSSTRARGEGRAAITYWTGLTRGQTIAGGTVMW